MSKLLSFEISNFEHLSNLLGFDRVEDLVRDIIVQKSVETLEMIKRASTKGTLPKI
jgi:hypothetical protein